MAELSYEKEIIEAVHQLTPDQQRRVLDFTRNFTRLKGEPGWLFLERTKDIHIDPEDLEVMKQAIEEDCERIN